MPIREKTRNEISSSSQWDLTKIYINNDLWYKEYQEVELKAKNFNKFKGTVLNDPDTLLQVLNEYINISKSLSKLYVYSYMKSDEDTSNTYYQELKGKVDNLNKKISESTSFLIPELLAKDYSFVINFINQQPKLKVYQRMLEEIYRLKPYTLSDKDEKLLSSMSNILDNPSKTASLIRNSDLKFDSIVDEDGNLVELSNSNYNKYIESNNRQVRKAAFESLYKGYKGVKNTIASTLAGQIEANNTIARLRGYKSARHMSLFQNQIDENIYDNLVKVVNDNLSVLHKYYNLRKKYLGLEKLTLYDVHVPLIATQQKEYSFDEARKIVIDALKILGDDYIENIEKAFNENWIDIYPNAFKRSGAYSWGTYDTPSYILLNYQNRLSDISTLFHELGHSMHSYYSRKHNEYQDSQYKIFVAEVASITNELLFYDYLLKKSNDQLEKQKILNYILDLFKSTLYRQTMFAEFEQIIHEKANNNEIITCDLLSKIYYELNKKYFGEDVFVNNEIKYEWARIPHFYTSFYVYQYATGLAAATYFAKSIIDGVDGVKEKYLEFLKTGGRDNPIQLLKNAGIDMNNPDVINSSIKWFNELIDEFVQLSK